MHTILIADDERNIRSSLSTTFRLEGHHTVTVSDGREAVDRLARGDVDLAIVDLQMPEMDGLEVLRALRERSIAVPVMILTAHGSIERAVEAVRLGAFDFIEKPPHAERMLVAARNALRQARLVEENRELRAEFDAASEMVGGSPPMRALAETIERVAPTRARVLILGENGTGKELVARAIHRGSPRASRPFVAVNCAAVPKDLFESELFGHERGAFTGATAKRRGKFVKAHGGTLFLDEVAEIPLDAQPKLLRALETSRFEAVGSDREVEVDVRVLAATNRDIEAEIEAGRFREDLYYRLQVVTLTVPPLAERREDVPALAARFFEDAFAEHGIRPRAVGDDAYAALSAHSFPGNVRELKNVVERIVILAAGGTITAGDVASALPARWAGEARPDAAGGTLRDVLAATERRVVRDALERHGWKMAATARDLGLERSHLYKKLKALGIEREDGSET